MKYRRDLSIVGMITLHGDATPAQPRDLFSGLL
jgi:hypothetical protein